MYTKRLTTFPLEAICTNGTNGTKAALTNGDQFTNGTIGEGVLTIGVCLEILEV